MKAERITYLIRAYQENSISSDDARELWEYILNHSDEELEKLLDDPDSGPRFSLPVNSGKIWMAINRQIDQPERKKISIRLSYIAAAAVFILIGTFSIYQLQNRKAGHLSAYKQVYTKAAEADEAIITLSDGTLISLNTMKGKNLRLYNGARLSVDLDGAVSYANPTETAEQHSTLINTVSSPKGKVVKIKLSDETIVYLNASSSISYPIQFAKSKREVRLQGEAYFEVFKSKTSPFIVKTKQQELQVLGTKFNMQAYDDDRVHKTTLLEGQVKVRKNTDTKTPDIAFSYLKPDQQFTTAQNNNEVQIKNVAAADLISWKDNLFVFNNEDLEQALKTISRWYDVEIIYDENLSGKRIGGTVPKLKEINDVMLLLQETKLLKFQWKGGKLVIIG